MRTVRSGSRSFRCLVDGDCGNTVHGAKAANDGKIFNATDHAQRSAAR